jgi:arylsulfatase A-like enzyme
VGWHSHTLYDELLRVPLLLKLPAEHGGESPAEGAAEGATVETQVRLLDLAPTLTAAAGIPIPEVFSGTDLRPLLDEAGSLRLPAVSQIDVPGWGETSIRTRRWKLWGERLFDLERDPAEILDVSSRYPERVRALGEARQRALARRPDVTGEAAGLGAEAAEELRALGYLD